MILWQRDWRAFDEPEKEAEFLRELLLGDPPSNPKHPLHGKECRILGWTERGWKHFMLSLPVEAKFAYVHLTWNEETDPRWPSCKPLNSVDEVNEFLRKWPWRE